ncbi:MAG TPA: hypothetical protein VL728_19455 [Cyclobacteriaceae bacterium]|jgi:hypothetical protein|nr:hypothetical protein [Cyclobacteriaceae bacterium]
MAISILQKPNTDGVSADYPYGNIRDNSGSGDGTPVNKFTNADFHQFFAKIMDAAGIVHNGLPDNSANGFQLYTALKNIIDGDITAAINAVVNGAPSTLDTLKELADALGNDANLATTITNLIAAETANRINADNTLQNNINNEATTRSIADNAEAVARAAADIVLQNNINAASAVVGTYSPALTSVQNITAISLAAPFIFKVINGLVEIWGTVNVFPSTSGSWGNVAFQFDLPGAYSPTFANDFDVNGGVSGVFRSVGLGTATTPISGIVEGVPGDSRVQCVFTSQNPANSYTVKVHAVYHL